MLKLILYIALAVVVFSACSKSSEEHVLYGAWTKDSNPNDTLWFVQKNGVNIMRYRQTQTSYAEWEYRFSNNQLQVAMYGSEWTDISSFAWKQPGRQFEVVGPQLFWYLSSTAKISYTKL